MQSAPSPSSDKQLTWMEPSGFRKAEIKNAWKSMLGIAGLTAGTTAVFLGVAVWLDLWTDVAWKLLVTAGTIVILCLVLLACTRLMRITVKITEQAIAWELGETSTVYRFGAVDHCEIRNASVGSRSRSVLVIVLKNGDRETLGIASSISIENLLSTLEQRGVKVVTRTGSMSK